MSAKSNGKKASGDPSLREHLNDTAQTARDLVSEAKQTLASLDLKGRVEKNPYGMIAAALGVGYVLGGGLFTPTTARVLRLGMRLASLPVVRETLLTAAEAAVAGMGGTSPEGGAEGSIPKA